MMSVVFQADKVASGDEFSGVFSVKNLKKDVCELLSNCIRQFSLHTALLGIFLIVTIDISKMI